MEEIYFEMIPIDYSDDEKISNILDYMNKESEGIELNVKSWKALKLTFIRGKTDQETYERIFKTKLSYSESVVNESVGRPQI